MPPEPRYDLDTPDRYAGMVRRGGSELQTGLNWLMSQEQPRMTPAMLSAMQEVGNPLTTAQTQTLADRGDPWAKNVAGQWPVGGGADTPVSPGGFLEPTSGGAPGPGIAGSTPATGSNAGVAGGGGNAGTSGLVTPPPAATGNAGTAGPPLGPGDPFATPQGAANVAMGVSRGLYSPFELPDTQGAMTGLRGLQTDAVGGFRSLLAADPAAARKAVEDAMYASQAEGINRQADQLGRGLEENAFSRGVGLSSIALDRSRDLDRERLDALGRASREAFIGAGNESRADQAARLSALGTAFNAGTSGLQGEANVGLTNAGRDMQANQFGANMGFQGFENALNRDQQNNQFNANLGLSNRQLDLNERGQNMAGIAAGLGGLANFFGPTIKAGQSSANSGLMGLFSGGGG